MDSALSQRSKHLEGTLQLLQDLRSVHEFAGVMATEKELSVDIEIEPNYLVEPEVRARHTRRQIEYEGRDDPVVNRMVKFRTELFYFI